jgi:hypothetical protein
MSSVLRRTTGAEELELGGWTPPPVGPELEEPEIDGPSTSGGVSLAFLALSVSTVASGLGDSGALEGGDGMVLLAGSILTVASEGFPVAEFW